MPKTYKPIMSEPPLTDISKIKEILNKKDSKANKLPRGRKELQGLNIEELIRIILELERENEILREQLEDAFRRL